MSVALPKIFVTLIIIQSMLSACFTTKVSDLVYQKPKPFQSVNVEKAVITDEHHLYLLLQVQKAKASDTIWLEVNFNANELIEYYSFRKAPIVALFDDHYQATGIHSFTADNYDSASVYTFFLTTQNLELPNLKEVKQISGTDISTYITLSNSTPYGLVIDCAYAPEWPFKVQLSLPYPTRKANTWAYALYPFAFTADVLTFPVQMIVVLVAYKHPFQN